MAGIGATLAVKMVYSLYAGETQVTKDPKLAKYNLRKREELKIRLMLIKWQKKIKRLQRKWKQLQRPKESYYKRPKESCTG